MSAEDDQHLNELRAECAKAIADYLQKSVNLQRSIASLSKAEMLGMAEAATAQWVISMSRYIQEAKIIGDVRLDERTSLLSAG